MKLLRTHYIFILFFLFIQAIAPSTYAGTKNSSQDVVIPYSEETSHLLSHRVLRSKTAAAVHRTAQTTPVALLHAAEVITEPQRNLSFMDRVLQSARPLHRIIGETRVMNSITTETMTREQLIRYHHGIYHLYQIIEPYLSSHPMKQYRSFYIKIRRLDVLEKDLRILQPEFEGLIEDLPALTEYQAYRDHLESIADQPDMLFAHIFVRYGSNLFGGQKIKQRLKRLPHYKSPLGYNEFGDEKNVARLKKEFSRLTNDILVRSPEIEKAFLDEITKAYELSTALYKKLGWPPNDI